MSRVPGRGAPSEFISTSEALPDASTPAAPAPAQAWLAARQQRTRAAWAELQQGRSDPLLADRADGLGNIDDATRQGPTAIPAWPDRERPAESASTSAAVASAARSAAPSAPATLHIGRIDITVQAPPPAAPARSPAPAADSAYLSRHYLRRL
ncbi:hypothetical protein [Ideonella sp. B508-1]|uniref:hypothetical protein n=1 Tax=Ideonella sp. B508-1 TaxID=137716 RepID=UPI0003B4786E|nr:hypothetical protein [Ideonella sp. B508-1]